MEQISKEKRRWLIGIILTLVLGLPALIIKNVPKFEYDILSTTKLFSALVPSSCIKVFIEDSINVQENNYSITIFRIKIKNKGLIHIKDNEYDEDEFFGLKIFGGALLDSPVLVSTSNNHVKSKFQSDKLNHCNKGSSEIKIPPIVLDRGDSYVIEAMILHNEDSIPCLTPQGRIIGQKKDIRITYAEKSIRSLLHLAFDGSWEVQLIRCIPYLMATLLFLMVSLSTDRRPSKTK